MHLAQEELNPLVPHPVELLGGGLVLLLLLMGTALLVVLAVRAAGRGRRGRRDRGREARTVGAVRWTGVLLGGVLALFQLGETLATAPGITPRTLLPSAGLGVGALHAPVIFGVVTLLFVVLGELVVRPRYDDGPRTADLRPRRVRDFLPPLLAPALVGLGACAVALCTFTVLTASADDMGRAGRSLAAACSAVSSSARGPYPGSFYVLPYALGLAAALVVAGAAAWRVTSRPLAGTPAQADHHRRTSMRAITGAVGVVLSAPLVGIASFASITLLQHSCPRPGWVPVGWLSFGVGWLALVGLVVSLVALLAPVTTLEDARPADRESVGA